MQFVKGDESGWRLSCGERDKKGKKRQGKGVFRFGPVTGGAAGQCCGAWLSPSNWRTWYLALDVEVEGTESP